jgi:SAM-dependent methyltransferase
MPAETNVYDAVEYPAFSYPDTHPDHLAVMAMLHGLQPAPVETCRVLEIGCSEGANLIPMAYAIPGGSFTGFDLAGSPIARGQQRIRELDLANIRLFQGDLLEVDVAPENGGLGEYDYILAHGVYAWVPEPVRDRLLAVCAEHLAPNGVAFISYNALPGSHMRNMVRDLMNWHADRTQSAGNAEQQVAYGLNLLEKLLHARPDGDAYRQLLEGQLATMRRRSPRTLFHDELSEVYHPVLLTTFVEHARRHGLEYLSEAVLPPPTDPGFRPELMESLRGIAGEDIVALEQMLDYARMRMYHETLLIRGGHSVRREFAAEPFRKMRFTASATSSPGEREEARVFTLADGLKVGCDQPSANAVMERLIAARPHTVGYDEIWGALVQSGLPSKEHAARLLQQMAVARLIDLRTWQPPLAKAVSSHPRATATSRQEARLRSHAATLWHGTVKLEDPIVRSLVQLLDGTRDRAALLAAFRSEFPSIPAEELEKGIDPNLAHLFRAALLEA